MAVQWKRPCMAQASIASLFWLLCYWLIVESVDPSIKLSSYVSACHSILLTLTGVSFVDDTGLGITLPNSF
jgi:hypothetical protein